jgi:hypothetical protein
MAARRFWRALLAVIASLALVAACGGDDDGGEETGSPPADDGGGSGSESSDDDPDIGDVLGDEDCRAILAVGAVLAAAFTPGSAESEELSEARDFFGGDAEVPDEIADDVAVMADYFEVVVEAYQNADVDFENADDVDPQEAASKFGQIAQEIQANVDQDEVDAASENLQEWGNENCS